MLATLASLAPGRAGVLRDVRGERAFRRRLLELGFVPGTRVRVIRRVAVGDVLEVDVRDCRVSLRISEAAALEVEPEA